MSPAGGGVAGNPRYATGPLRAASPAIGGMKPAQSAMWMFQPLGAQGATSWSTSMGAGASLSLAPPHRDWQPHLADRELMAAHGSRIARTEPGQGTVFL